MKLKGLVLSVMSGIIITTFSVLASKANGANNNMQNLSTYCKAKDGTTSPSNDCVPCWGQNCDDKTCAKGASEETQNQ